MSRAASDPFYVGTRHGHVGAGAQLDASDAAAVDAAADDFARVMGDRRGWTAAERAEAREGFVAGLAWRGLP